MKRGPAWDVVACNVETQCQNLNRISFQNTGVVLLAPNFMNHLVISFKHASKKSHCRTFAQLTPSGKLAAWASVVLLMTLLSTQRANVCMLNI